MTITTPLATAIILWKRGLPLPVDLFVQLHNEGHDVPRLEAKYRA
jgi:hypothetical protein